MNNKTILVTGATGFVGGNICRYLKSNYDCTVIGLDRTIKNTDEVMPGKVTYIQHDLRTHKDLDLILKDYSFDYVFHQGAITDTTYTDNDIYEINSESIKSFIKLCERHDCKLIYASSCATYGNTPIPNTVGIFEEPLNIYGKSKLNADNIVRDYLKSDESRVPIVGLRYSNVYGPGEYNKKNMASMIYQIYNKYASGGLTDIKSVSGGLSDYKSDNISIKLFKYGEQKRDFIYIKDIIQYNIHSALSTKVGIYNAGYGNSFSFNDMMRYFELYFNKSIPIEFVDNPYPFFQTHTLCSLDYDLYKPVYSLKDGMFDYLDTLVKQ